MKQLTFLDKINILFEMIKSSTPILVLLFGIILLILLFIIITKINLKFKNRIFLGLYVILVIGIGIKYGSNIVQLLDNMVDNIFLTIYFPSLLSYIIMLIMSNIILIVSFIKNGIANYIKVINVSCYLLIVFFLVIILNIIIKNNIDIYSKTEVYSNQELLSMIELSTIVFALWIIILLVIMIINKLTKKFEKKEDNNICTKLDVNNKIKIDTNTKNNTLPARNKKQKNKKKVIVNKQKSSKIAKRMVDNKDINNKKVVIEKDTILTEEEKIDKIVNNIVRVNPDGHDNPITPAFALKKRNDKFMNALNKQFDENVLDENLDIKFLINQIMDKNPIGLDDYNKLRELMNIARDKNILSEDELSDLINKINK